MKINFGKEIKINGILRFVAFIAGIISFIYGISTKDFKGGLMGLVTSLTIMNVADIEELKK